MKFAVIFILCIFFLSCKKDEGFYDDYTNDGFHLTVNGRDTMGKLIFTSFVSDSGEVLSSNFTITLGHKLHGYTKIFFKNVILSIGKNNLKTYNPNDIANFASYVLGGNTDVLFTLKDLCIIDDPLNYIQIDEVNKVKNVFRASFNAKYCDSSSGEEFEIRGTIDTKLIE